jgi:hypothetical protein
MTKDWEGMEEQQILEQNAETNGSCSRGKENIHRKGVGNATH